MKDSESDRPKKEYYAIATCPVCKRSVKISGGGVDSRYMKSVEDMGEMFLEREGCTCFREKPPQIVFIPVRNQ